MNWNFKAADQDNPAGENKPEFSKEARDAKYQGTRTLGFTVGVDGLPTDIHIIKSLGKGPGRESHRGAEDLEVLSRHSGRPARAHGSGGRSRISSQGKSASHNLRQ
jgi:hypothetical protein